MLVAKRKLTSVRRRFIVLITLFAQLSHVHRASASHVRKKMTAMFYWTFGTTPSSIAYHGVTKPSPFVGRSGARRMDVAS
jgi:hypothetical protein